MSFLTNPVIDNSTLNRKMKLRAIAEERMNQVIIHPSTLNLRAVRCPICNFLLGFVDGRAQLKCHKCKYLHLEDNNRVAPTTNDLD